MSTPTWRPFVLVSCCGPKLSEPAPARDLYTSSLFGKHVALAEAWGCDWAILSAAHGLVLPDEIVEPYDLALKETEHSYRRRLAKKLQAQLKEHRPGLWRAAVFGGRDYVELAELAGLWVWEPMRGMQIGERLRWLKRELEAVTQ